MELIISSIFWSLGVAAGLALQVMSVYIPQWFRHRRIIGSFFFAWYLFSFPLAWVVTGDLRFICCAMSLYLIVLAAQQFTGRFNAAYIKNSVTSAAVGFGAVLLLIIIAQTVSAVVLLQLAISLSVAFGVFMLFGTWLNQKRYHIGPFSRMTKLDSLPTVTLAIPARNETIALDEALTLAVKSDYPKLEILVLDDCSQDKTSATIKSYAQDGVRFIQGKLPADSWLGKNYACQTLAEQATGDIIIYAGVDTHFAVDSIGKIVSYMQRYKLSMLSVLPRRRSFDLLPHVLLPLSQIWQLVFPITRRNMAVASACWAVQADELKRLGGFGAVKNSIFPQVHFAKRLFAENKYRFIAADDQLGVTTRKRLESQMETSLRTLYPRFKRSPLAIFLITMGIFIVFYLPYIVLLGAVMHQSFSLVAGMALVAIVLFTVAHEVALYSITPQNWWIGIFTLPIQLIWEVVLLNFSMLLFEFSEVNWKGRNVCYPVIEAINPRAFKEIVDTLPTSSLEK